MNGRSYISGAVCRIAHQRYMTTECLRVVDAEKTPLFLIGPIPVFDPRRRRNDSGMQEDGMKIEKYYIVC